MANTKRGVKRMTLGIDGRTYEGVVEDQGSCLEEKERKKTYIAKRKENNVEYYTV